LGPSPRKTSLRPGTVAAQLAPVLAQVAHVVAPIALVLVQLAAIAADLLAVLLHLVVAPRAPIARTTSGAPQGLYLKPGGAVATKVPVALVPTVVVEASPPALKLRRTRSERAKYAP